MPERVPLGPVQLTVHSMSSISFVEAPDRRNEFR